MPPPCPTGSVIRSRSWPRPMDSWIRTMPRDARTITRADLLSVADYNLIRKDKREEHLLRKRLRRLSVGPHATILFESWDSMWFQVQEMLRIEKGGEAQIPDELAAYNPM